MTPEPFLAVRVGGGRRKTHFWKQQVLFPSVSSILLLSSGGTQGNVRTSLPGFGTGAGSSGQVNSRGVPGTLHPNTVSGAGGCGPPSGAEHSPGGIAGVHVGQSRGLVSPIKIIPSWTRQGRWRGRGRPLLAHRLLSSLVISVCLFLDNSSCCE